MALESVESEIGGFVRKILVKPGDKVLRNDTLIVLESMKMEITVEAPTDGIVKEIRVSIDEVIKEGQVVAIVEK